MMVTNPSELKRAKQVLERLWEKPELADGEKKLFLALAHGISDYHARVQRYVR